MRQEYAVPAGHVSPPRDDLVLVPCAGSFGTVGLRHPPCTAVADVCVDLDCAYCSACDLNIRISGAYVVHVLEGEPA